MMKTRIGVVKESSEYPRKLIIGTLPWFINTIKIKLVANNRITIKNLFH